MLINLDENKNTYVISDAHFFHKNIISYCSRPFKTTNEMNETMFNNWNNTVTDDDIILFGGDFVMGAKNFGHSNNEAAKLVYDNLNGEKIFIRGNHDKGIKLPFLEDEINLFNYKGYSFTFTHHPIDCFSTDFLLYGHIHNNPHSIRNNKRAFNCSMEDNNYTPVHLDKVLERLLA